MGETSSERKTLPTCDQSTPEVPVGTLHQLVGDADTDDRTDEGMRAGGRQSVPPGTQVPEDGRNQQGEDHGESGARSYLEDQLDWKERDHGKGDRSGRQQHPDQVPHAGPHHGNMRFERVGVDHGSHRIGSVVEPVDELKPQRDQQRDTEQGVGHHRGGTRDREEVAKELGRCPSDAANKHKPEDDHRDLALFPVHFVVH